LSKSHILTYPDCIWPMSIVAKWSPISATAKLLCKVDTHGGFWSRYIPAGRGGLHRRGAELPLCDVASHGAVSSAVVLLTNQWRRVACSVDADQFSYWRRSGNAGVDAWWRRSGNAGVDADDGLWVRSCESAKL